MTGCRKEIKANYVVFCLGLPDEFVIPPSSRKIAKVRPTNLSSGRLRRSKNGGKFGTPDLWKCKLTILQKNMVAALLLVILKILGKVSIALVILVIVGIIGIRLAEQKMIYYPMVFPRGYWDTSHFPGRLEDCTFRTEDGVTLHGWFAHAVAPDTRPRRTLLFLHGNAGNITHRQTNIVHLIQCGLNVFIFDYRGYGKSEGTPSEQGLYADAASAYEYLLARKDVQPEHIVFFGRSLGGAVAVELATRKPCEKLILESTFTSIKGMVREIFGLLPVHYLIRSQFDSLAKIRTIHVPLLVIHGNQDTIVPFEQGKQLFAAANAPKFFYEIHGADHNDTYDIGGDAYFERLKAFIYE
ncbi:phospholipase/carboxylesterase [Candidatus Vecturithrix granuli]|uniref:Phospholipase/carboxylesterase n=1 Tax=Vecturithrix granuli TaxID=1499967 RepID=A0A0S6W5P7_VECG1|nr:phospholipase/carboxylesterase [Candidatus Vecturithrix granuli]